MKKEEVHKIVRENYGKIAQKGGSCCGGSSTEAGAAGCCCGGAKPVKAIGKMIGYSEKEMDSVPDGANLGLGCGNPVALASLKKGETVLDLGSGAGFDCFLAAAKVGPKGKVIGVDMTAEMLDKARENARKGKYSNVEFRLGEIENLPVADNTADAVISNCVINLSTDKPRVFQEAFRVLQPGGRLMVSDIVLLESLPEYIQRTIAAYIGCLAGALLKDDYIKAIKKAGFKEVKIVEETPFPLDAITSDPVAKSAIEDFAMPMEQISEIAASIVSIKIQAQKP